MPNYITGYELQKQAKEQVKEIVQKMNGMTEDEFYEKYIRDPHFHNGVEVFTQLFMEAKFK